jgi:hypothetical protein
MQTTDNEGITKTKETPDEFEGLFDDPITVLVPSKTDSTKIEEFTVLPANPTTEQIQTALKTLKPTCAGIVSEYSCGNHDTAPAYSGEIISVNAGDEIAMNTLIISIVDIDGSGNGSGLIKVPMLNNIKLGVTLSGIKVAEGGCVVAGKAELSGIDVAILNDKQRQNLAKAYEIYKKTLDIAEELAPEIAKGINSVKDYFESIKAKKEATRKLLAQSNIEDLSEVLNNCGEIVSQSRLAQDSLEKTICLIKTGKAKGNIAKLEKASKANIDFINKLGPALAQCQNTIFTPWSEQPCKGPCGESFVVDYTNFDCQKELKGVFGVKTFGFPNDIAVELSNPQALTICDLTDTRQFCYRDGNHAQSITLSDGTIFRYIVCGNIVYYHLEKEIQGISTSYSSEYWLINDEYWVVQSTNKGIYKKCVKGEVDFTEITLEKGECIGEAAADRLAMLFVRDTPLLLVSGITAGNWSWFAFDQLSDILINQLNEQGLLSDNAALASNILLAFTGKEGINTQNFNKFVADLATDLRKLNKGSIKPYILSIIDKMKKLTVNGVGNDLFISAREFVRTKYGQNVLNQLTSKFGGTNDGAAAVILQKWGDDGLAILNKSSVNNLDDAAKELVKNKTMYRYVNETSFNFDKIKTQGLIDASPSQFPGYATLDKIDNATQAQSILQLPKKPNWVAEFSSTQIASDVRFPTGKFNNADYVEVLTRSYPEWGVGGGSQFITNSQIKVARLKNLETGEIINFTH